MTEEEAFKQTQEGMIKRRSKDGSKIYMYIDRTGFIVLDGGIMRDARQYELVGFGNWIPAEDGFENNTNKN